MPESTSWQMASRFAAPLLAEYSAPVWRNHMHQQPPYAPDLPKRASNSPQRLGVRGCHSNATIARSVRECGVDEFPALEDVSDTVERAKVERRVALHHEQVSELARCDDAAVV